MQKLSNSIEIRLLSDDVPFEGRGTNCYHHLIALDEGEKPTVLLLLRLSQLDSESFDIFVKYGRLELGNLEEGSVFVRPEERQNMWYPLVHYDWMPILSLRHWIVYPLCVFVFLLDFRGLAARKVEFVLTLEADRELMILKFHNGLP